MRRRYVRREPKRRDTITAAAMSVALAAGVGAVTFYVTRLLLARETLVDSSDVERLDAPRD